MLGEDGTTALPLGTLRLGPSQRIQKERLMDANQNLYTKPRIKGRDLYEQQGMLMSMIRNLFLRERNEE